MTPTGSNGGSASSIQVSFAKTEEVAETVVGALASANVPLGYGILGCALAILRLSLSKDSLSAEEEIKFVQDLTDWVGAYWDEEGVLN